LFEWFTPGIETSALATPFLNSMTGMLRATFLVLVATILSLIPRTAAAQSEGVDIRGIVADSTNGERLPGVNVVVEGTGRGWVTNVNGFYLIAAVPRGRHTVTASAVGYWRKTLTVDIAGTEPITLSIILVPRVIESSEITIEGEREGEESQRNASIHVVTPHDIQQVPSAAQADLFRSMELLPGIASTSDVNSKFYVRGGAADQNLVLLDGMKLFNPFHAYGSFGVLDPQIIKSAEIYTGAFPANYGNRLSSVVNVTTRDGNRSSFAGDAGINFLSANVGLEGPIKGDNSWLVSGRKSLFDRTLEKIVPSAAPTSFYDLFFKGTIGNSTGRVGIRGFINNDEIKPGDPTQPGHAWRSAAFAGVISGLITDRIYMDLTLNLSTSEIIRSATVSSPVPAASSRISEWNFRGEFDVYPENQDHFAVGFESAFPNIRNVLPTRAGTERPYDDNEGELWLWFRYIASLGPLGVDAGIHTELNTISDAVLGNRFVPLRQILQPRLTVSYNVTGNWVAKAAYGVFTQNIITINNEDDLISLFDAWVYLPDKLRPEEADHYVLGIEGNITPQLSARIQGYLKDYRSIALYNPDKIFPEDPDYISGTGSSSGIETLLRYSLPLTDIYASYVLSRARVSSTGITYAPRYDQTHAVKAMAVLHLLENIDITVRWEYGSGYPYTQNAGYYSRLSLADLDKDPFPGGTGDPMRVLGAKNAARLPAYRRLDAGFACRFTLRSMHGSVGVNILNIQDAQNILYYDRVTGKTDYMMPFFPSAFITAEF
jgi:hypothetical protein